jgi:hypothetical protein
MKYTRQPCVAHFKLQPQYAPPKIDVRSQLPAHEILILHRYIMQSHGSLEQLIFACHGEDFVGCLADDKGAWIRL